MSKVSIIGAGNVGATAAMKMAMNLVASEIVLLDIKEGIAEGKAMDIMQCSMADDFSANVIGVTNDYSATRNSDVIVITSGVARKPGMTREDLVGINSNIMKNVIVECNKYSQKAIYVVVSNPMDTMTMQTINILEYINPGADFKKRVIGMGGLLDSSRFRYFIWKELVNKGEHLKIDNIQDAWVVGGHGDVTMIPITENVKIIEGSSINDLKDYFTDGEIEKIVENTMKGGSILTNLLGTSAWEAPGACIAETVDAILYNGYYSTTPRPFSVYREEYGCCIGSMVTLNRDGVLSIEKESDNIIAKMKISAEAIKKVNAVIPNI